MADRLTVTLPTGIRLDARRASLLVWAGFVLGIMPWAAAFHHHGSEPCDGRHHPECPVFVAGLTAAVSVSVVVLFPGPVCDVFPPAVLENPPPRQPVSAGIVRAPPFGG